MSQTSPWIARFGEEPTDAELTDRIRVSPAPLQDLDRDQTEVAARRLEAALKEVFVPTTQVVAASRKLRSMARVYALQVYRDHKQFLRTLYSQHWAEPVQFPTCLTGLGGVGKSALLQAVGKIMPADIQISVPGHGDLTTTSLWSFVVRPRLGTYGVLERVTESTAEAAEAGRKLEINGTVAYRDGVTLITADEFQAITYGGTANARATKTLIQLAQVGPPLVFCANYSLVHQLIRRPQQDRQRLLSDPIVLDPDLENSEDWFSTLKACKRVGPDTFTFDPIAHAAPIHRYTAGNKRCLNSLLVCGYRAGRERGAHKVGIKELEAAYWSIPYSANRQDVEMLVRQAIENRPCGRLDLWSPFPRPSAVQGSVVLHPSIEGYKQRIDDELMRSSLTAAERRALDELQSHDDHGVPPRMAAVVRLKRRAATKEDLLKGLIAFQQEMLHRE